MTNRFASIAAAAALLSMPAWAIAAPSNAGHGHGATTPTTPATTPTTPDATTPTTPAATTPTTPPATTPGKTTPKGKAYGFYCQGQSKKHVAGTPGTPFSSCVKAMKALDKGTTTSPTVACKPLSKKHVHGTKGTPFSRCVKAGHQLLADKA
jgi:hypothetical protein